MAGERYLTVDHERIRKWVEARDGRPVTLPSTGRRRDPGLIRLEFPASSQEGHFEPLEWPEWFRRFDATGMVLLHQDTLADGRESGFCKLISRATAQEAARHGAEWVGRDRGALPEGRRAVEATPRVDINRASADELGQLSGIGPEHARGILRLRSRGGRIRELDELLDVEGIDGATLQGIRKRVRTE